MSKGKLILIENIDCCGECFFCYPAIMDEHEEVYRCFITGSVASTTISDDCPLRTFPEKRNTTSLIETKREAEENHVTVQHQVGFNLGWNACIDAITGGKDEKTRNDKEP